MDNAIKIAQIIITISQGVIMYGNENDAPFFSSNYDFVNQSGKKRL